MIKKLYRKYFPKKTYRYCVWVKEYNGATGNYSIEIYYTDKLRINLFGIELQAPVLPHLADWWEPTGGHIFPSRKVERIYKGRYKVSE